MNQTAAANNGAAMLSFDEFMTFEGSKGGGGGYLGGWKKNGEGPKDGQVTVYLHRKSWAAPRYLHNWPRVVEIEDEKTGDKVLRVWSQRWNCHERELVCKKQHFTDRKTGEREYPPEICPICKLVEYVAEMYRLGTWELTKPIFKFEGGLVEETLIFTVGGIIGRYGAKELKPAEERAMRAARVRRDEAYKEDLRAKLKYLYLVLDQAHPEDGVQKTWEGQGLTNKIKKAVADERKKYAKKGKEHFANPVEHPYPFEWTYDDGQAFDDKFDVLALIPDEGTGVDDAIMKAISGEPPDVSRDLASGDCYALRAEMEAHLVKGVVMPWDRLFGAADKAGLMKPPPETKGDEDASFDPDALEGDGSAEGGERPPFEHAQAPVFVIATDHAAWSTAGWIAPAEVKGCEVHMDPPDTVDDAKIDAVEKACTTAGAVFVTWLVECDHCKQTMTMADPSCGACGSRYSEDGKIASRPCLVKDCGGQCILAAERPKVGEVARAVCEKCAQIHEEIATNDPERGAQIQWVKIEPEKPKEAASPPKAARRRPGPTASAAGASSGGAARGDAIPFAK